VQVKYVNILFEQLILCRWLSSCMAILDALSPAGSGVAFEIRAARVFASATLAFCSACLFADLTLVLPRRFKITPRQQR